MGEQLSESNFISIASFWDLFWAYWHELQLHKPQKRHHQLWQPLNSQSQMPHRAATAPSMRIF
jgi:hypothetical protein